MTANELRPTAVGELHDYDVHYCMEPGDDFVYRCSALDRTDALLQLRHVEPNAVLLGVWLTEEMDYAGTNCDP